MIITAADYKSYYSTELADWALEDHLRALELFIRGYTNNPFQVPGARRDADIVGGVFVTDSPPFRPGDTIQVTKSALNQGLYTVAQVTAVSFTALESALDEQAVRVTLVRYPEDVRMGAAALLNWQLENEEHTGVQSESISRHSIAYQALTADNTRMGYPLSLMGFLSPYQRVRFGS